MKKKDAKQILQVCRPNGQDAHDPVFAEALRHLAKDPALAKTFSDQQKFDSAMARAVQGIPVPTHLRASLLASRKVIHPTPWWRQSVPAAWPSAIAALLVLLVAVGAFWIRPGPRSFSDYRNNLVKESWRGSPHLDIETSEIGEIKGWMARQHAPVDFTVPTALQDMPIRGCRTLDCAGQKVSVICFGDGFRHTHLFVMDRMDFPDMLPAQGPDFEKCHGWKTASWSQGEATYVLAGMKYQTFIKRFRKSGQWNMAG